jgi:hypothetical protein
VQFFSGTADWNAIGEVVEAVPTIPIIGNGDVSQPEHAQALIRRTGCAGVMIARAALRTPWLFRRAHALLTTGTVSPEPTLVEKLDVVLRHLDLTAQYDGEQRAAIRLRQHIAWYGKSMGHVKPIKEAIRLAPDFATPVELWRLHALLLRDPTRFIRTQDARSRMSFSRQVSTNFPKSLALTASRSRFPPLGPRPVCGDQEKGWLCGREPAKPCEREKRNN